VPDRYLPELSDFVIDEDEQAAIEAALATPDPWDWKPGGAQEATIQVLKTRIREYHLARHGHRCCYCRRNLHGEFLFVIDREHVLPKSVAQYRPLSFKMWNLGSACKRCNMQYKGSKTDFVVVPGDGGLLESANNYRFIHPTFDLFGEHLDRFSQEANDAVIVKYRVVEGSTKGAYTYDYFNLHGLEVGSFDDAQGRTQEDVDELGTLATAVRSLADAFGQ
jgi:hypothetical protein